MNKTLIEIYNDGLGLYSSLCAVFEAIDSRLSAIEHPSPPVQSAVDWLHEIDDRLSALADAHNLVAAQVLSDIKKGLPENVGLANEADMFVNSKSAQPAETEREWIPWNWKTMFWVKWSDSKELTLATQSELHTNVRSGSPTHVKLFDPLHPEKPEPPVDNEFLRGA